MNPTYAIFEQLLAEMKEQARTMRRNYYNAIVQKIGAREFPVSVTGACEELDALFGWERKNVRSAGRYPVELKHAHTFTEIKGEREAEAANKRGVYLSTYGNPRVIKPDVANIVEGLVFADVDQMFLSFINKQTAKVDGILKGRTVEVSGKITGQLECELVFKVSDGARFTMQTQIVWHVNRYGTQFYQFPTTFHAAYNAANVKITPASEKNLKDKL